MTYFDTAYILKCYVKEDGWQDVRALAQSRERIACSVYGRLELHAALHRKMRENDLTERQLDVVLRQFGVDDRAGIWTWLPLTTAIMTAVTTTFATLSRHVFLRTGDAVHLLTARQNGLDEVFSNDERLLAAAPEIGIAGRNVIA
ncbi:MAG: type II toxin-antitoxin system VapC family toxin [Spirochaetaceae bacterium]|nr:type II toxin-antitoxin system VapC family toxin [Spirochaetaceae bacterium]